VRWPARRQHASAVVLIVHQKLYKCGGTWSCAIATQELRRSIDGKVVRTTCGTDMRNGTTLATPMMPLSTVAGRAASRASHTRELFGSAIAERTPPRLLLDRGHLWPNL